MMIQTMRLDYADNREEISALNKILADIQRKGQFTPDFQETVDFILNRLDHLQLAAQAKLSLYDQRAERR